MMDFIGEEVTFTCKVRYSKNLYSELAPEDKAMHVVMDILSNGSKRYGSASIAGDFRRVKP